MRMSPVGWMRLARGDAPIAGIELREERIGIVYRGRLIALGSPDAIKDSARTADHPDPTLEDAFIALVEASDREGRP